MDGSAAPPGDTRPEPWPLAGALSLARRGLAGYHVRADAQPCPQAQPGNRSS